MKDRVYFDKVYLLQLFILHTISKIVIITKKERRNALFLGQFFFFIIHSICKVDIIKNKVCRITFIKV